jgi:hypothetical protein
MYIKLTEAGPIRYTLEQLYLEHKNTSFPANPSVGLLAEYGVYPLNRTPQPELSYTQNLIEGSPALVDGQWVEVWDVSAASPAEIAERVSYKWSDIRAQRDELLLASDWTQLADAPVDDLAWAVYRQALRDITQQADPFSIVWPIAP